MAHAFQHADRLPPSPLALRLLAPAARSAGALLRWAARCVGAGGSRPALPPVSSDWLREQAVRDSRQGG
ncbi:MAG TPA: hypothetical protein VD833_26935 [Vicinamibacterales bacterium]|nr:hypothetical protein [Vicinamibacterales bacterium]